MTKKHVSLLVVFVLLFTTLFTGMVFAADEEWVVADEITINVNAHIQSIGDLFNAGPGEIAFGTEGKAKRLERFEITLDGAPADMELVGMAHVQSYGDLPKPAGTFGTGKIGTAGEAKRIEGVAFKLVKKGTDTLYPGYRVAYAVHMQSFGWGISDKVNALVAKNFDGAEDFAYDGQFAGTRGLAKRVEAVSLIIYKEAELKVTEVSAINLKQLKVVFNAPVDKTSAETEANYKAYNGGATTDLVGAGTATLQADGRTVIIDLGTNFNNGTTAKVTVKNVKRANSEDVVTEYVNDSVAVADTVVPTIVGVAVTGPQTITVEYSEPVTNLNAAEYEVDDGNYIVTGATANGLNKVDIAVGVNLTTGEHKIKFKGTNVTDYAGYKVIPVTKTFTVAEIKSAPTVTVKSASPTEVKLVFSKPVSNVKDANVLYRHTYNSNTFQYAGNATLSGGADWITQVSSTEYTLNFSEKVIPLGANKLYITYSSSSGTKIQDLWGNKLEPTVLDLNITLDTTKPTVKEVKFVDAQTIKVIFSETVDQTTAETKSNYSVKDAQGKVVSIATATRTGTDNNEVILGFAANALSGGSYTVTIKGVKDNAFVKNVMDEYTTVLAINDTVKPTVLASKYFIDNIADTKTVKVYIPFSEAMDATKLVKANFLKNVNGAGFTALGDDDSIAIAGDAKSVVLTIKNGTTAITDIAIKVGALTDVAGNGFQTIIYDSVPGAPGVGQFSLTTDAIAVESVKAIGTKTIKVTFNGRLSSVSVTGYSLIVKDGTASGTPLAYNMSVTSHTVNSSNKSEVIFTLGTALAENAKVNTNNIQLVVNGATGTKSYLGVQVADIAADGDTPVAAADVQDYIVPTLNSVTFINSTQIEVKFNEAIDANTLASATLNGFSVKDGGDDLELTSVALKMGDATTVVLTGVDFVDGVTSVSYNSVAGLTDTNGNAVASFTDKVCD